VVAPISGSLRFDFWCEKIVNGKPIGVRKEQSLQSAACKLFVSRFAQRCLLFKPKTINLPIHPRDKHRNSLYKTGRFLQCEADHIPTPAWEHIQDMNSRTQPPWLGIHGDMDTIVPYRNAVTIKAQADKIGLLNELITIKGAGHVPIAGEMRDVQFALRFFMQQMISTNCQDELRTHATRNS
jgi:pimeloyl-ACP methyl ester carboxylesterase